MSTNIIEFWKTGENPITCYNSKPNIDTTVALPVVKERLTLKTSNRRQPVTIEDIEGKKVEIESVILAAPVLKISRAKLYNLLNERGKNDTGFKVYKSKINQ